jgi:hypothetical protein
MRILIINPPHPAIGSRIPREQLPPLEQFWGKAQEHQEIPLQIGNK